MTGRRPRRPQGRRRGRVATGERGGALLVGVLLVVLVAGVAVAAQDPYRSQQWNLDRIGAPDAWSLATGRQQVVAIIDSGVDLEHPDLVDRFVRRADGRVLGRDVVEDDDVPQDPLGHGTMVAGVAAATTGNGEGVAGVAPEAQLLPVRVLDRDGRGTSSDVDEGIRWAVDHGATVVNLSLESATSGDGDSLLGGATVAAPVAAVDYAWQHGVVVVAAAGNSGNGFTDYPRSSPIVLVGATDRDDERTSFSDSGRDDLLMAPGVDVVSTWCREAGDDRCTPGTHSYGIADGTSFAAPHVAGAIAVLRSAGLDADEAVDRLRATARDLDEPGPDPRTGRGLVDLAAATRGLEARAVPDANAPSHRDRHRHADPAPGDHRGDRRPESGSVGHGHPGQPLADCADGQRGCLPVRATGDRGRRDHPGRGHHPGGGPRRRWPGRPVRLGRRRARAGGRHRRRRLARLGPPALTSVRVGSFKVGGLPADTGERVGLTGVDMAHLVRHRTPSGDMVTTEVADLDEAVALVERLRNDDKAEDVRVYGEVPLRFETYVRVSIADEVVAPPSATAEAEDADDGPAPAPSAPVPPPPGVLTPVRVEAPSADADELVDANGTGDGRKGLFHR